MSCTCPPRGCEKRPSGLLDCPTLKLKDASGRGIAEGAAPWHESSAQHSRLWQPSAFRKMVASPRVGGHGHDACSCNSGHLGSTLDNRRTTGPDGKEEFECQKSSVCCIIIHDCAEVVTSPCNTIKFERRGVMPSSPCSHRPSCSTCTSICPFELLLVREDDVRLQGD